MSARDEQWGPWIEHDLSGCPLHAGVRVQIFSFVDPSDGETVETTMGCDYSISSWNMADLLASLHLARTGDRIGIIRYRIRKPRALQQLVEMVENLPAPQPEQVDA